MLLLKALATFPAPLEKPEHLLADTGYFSDANVQACQEEGIEPQARCPPSPGVRALCGGSSSTIERQSCRANGLPLEYAGGPSALRVAQAYRGTCLQDHQARDGVPAGLATKAG